MAINLKEERGRLIVTGPYDEMKDVFPKLKTRGFQYDSGSRAWWIDTSKLTPAKRKNIETLIRGGKEPEAPPTQESKEAKEAQREVWRELAKDLSKTRLFSFQVQVANPYFFILHIGGDTYSARDVFKAHGCTWETRYWELDLSKVPEAKARDLFKDLEKVSNQRAVRHALIKERIGDKPREWPTLEAALYMADGGIVTVKQKHANNDVKALITHNLPEAKYDSGAWRVLAHNVTEVGIKHLIEGLDKLEALEAERPKQTPPQPAAQPSQEGRPNRKPGHCRKCRGWVDVGEGNLLQFFDDDDEKIVYQVEHKDKAVCESNIAMAKAVAEKGRSRAVAKANLRRIICTGDNFVDPPAQGYLNAPHGERYELEPSGYGGGVSVVVEPGERHVWFIQGNSADGDDWGRNNIGGHSMGWRTELTDEIKGLLEVVLDRKIWSQ